MWGRSDPQVENHWIKGRIFEIKQYSKYNHCCPYKREVDGDFFPDTEKKMVWRGLERDWKERGNVVTCQGTPAKHGGVCL